MPENETTSTVPQDVIDNVDALLAEDQPIAAIRDFRWVMGCSVAEARGWVYARRAGSATTQFEETLEQAQARARYHRHAELHRQYVALTAERDRDAAELQRIAESQRNRDSAGHGPVGGVVTTVGDLRELLAALPAGTLVVLAKDAEGNGYSPLADADVTRYVADSAWSGELVRADDGTRLVTPDESTDGVPAVVLNPAN